MKQKIKIKDGNIAHCDSIAACFPPTHFDWVRDDEPVDEFTVISDSHVIEFNGGIAWLLEPRSVVPKAYEHVENNHEKYKHIFTYDKEILDRNLPNVHKLPFGSTRLDADQIHLFPKKRLCSLMTSNKNFTSGHDFRQKCRELCQHEYVGKVDLHIPTYDYIPKIDACKNYTFSIVVENGKFDYYFSEKLIDCFLTGTIPIYWGCPSIGDFFDIEGILAFDTIEDLQIIMDGLNTDEYIKRKEAIKYNFHKAKEYMITEDIMFNQYKHILIKS